MLRGCCGLVERGDPTTGPGERGRGAWLYGADDGLIGRDGGVADD